jgi:hypothetical protein
MRSSFRIILRHNLSLTVLKHFLYTYAVHFDYRIMWKIRSYRNIAQCLVRVIFLQDAVFYFSRQVIFKSTGDMFVRIEAVCGWWDRNILHYEPGSSVSIVSAYRLDDLAIEVRSTADERGSFLYPLCPERLWGPPSLLASGYRGPFPGVKCGRGVTLTNHPI